MAQFYTLTEVSMMGDPYFPPEPGAKPVQSYWCQVAEEELPVMIGKQVRDDGQPALQVGDQVYGELLKRTSGKGNPYWKYKSEKIPEGTPRPQQAPRTPAQAVAQETIGAVPGWFLPVANQINDIERMVKAIYSDIGGEVTQKTLNDAYVDPEPTPSPTAVPPANEQPDSVIDPETEKSLKEIFGDSDQ